MNGFFAIHKDLPREGPGDRASLDWALGRAGLQPDATICDAGCGPGADIAALLDHVPRGRVHAVDLHPPFVEAVRQRFADEPRVTADVADMGDLPRRYDFIWSAGAVYQIGIAAALASFRRALHPGGRAAFSDLCWTGPDRPAGAVAFWEDEYPQMTDIAGVEAQIGAAGGRVLDRLLLAPEAWENYYGPMEARLDALEPGAAGDLAEQIAAHRREIAVWRAHGDSFGYGLWLVVP